MVSFDISRADKDLVFAIVERAERLGWKGDRLSTIMDLTACAANGCPVDFDRLYEADDFNLMHDVAGVARHIDRGTGKLLNCFLPRFASRETAQ